MKLALTSILCALVMVLSYWAVLPFIPRNWFRPMYGDWNTENAIQAESTLHESSSKEIFIVGGSQTGSLKTSLLPKDSYVLSFAGRSSMDGAQMILESKAKPRFVFIEINSILRGRHIAFVEKQLNPRWRWLTEHFSFLRTRYRPEHLMLSLTHRLIYGLGEGEKRRRWFSSLTQEEIGKLYQEKRQKAYRHFEKVPEREVLHQKLSGLKSFVGKLQKRGARIFFYEMPADNRICESPRMKNLRLEMAQIFPPTEYVYLPRPDCKLTVTGDAIHMSLKSAEAFTKILAKQIEEIRLSAH